MTKFGFFMIFETTTILIFENPRKVVRSTSIFQYNLKGV